MVAKYLGQDDADLPSFVRTGPAGNAGFGYLGPRYAPFSVERGGKMPSFTSTYLPTANEERRNEPLRSMEDESKKKNGALPYESHRVVKDRALRLLRVKLLFDTSEDWPAREQL